MACGYTGKILRVDLTNRVLSVDRPSEEFYRTYMGGSALNLYYLLKEMDAKVDPLSPGNILAFSVSTLTGARVSGQSRLTITAKSPLTGAIGDSQSGGFFPAKLKFAGFDAVIVTGRAAAPLYLFIDEGKAELREAGHLWGKTTEAVEAAIKDELDDQENLEILQVGPAGEVGVRYANVVSMCCRANGRTGMGAVLGSKNFKAIVVRGFEEPEIADRTLLKEVIRTGAELFKNPANSGFGKYGTAIVLGVNNGLGGLPTNNWQSGSFDDYEAIDGPTLYDEALMGAADGRQESLGRDTCFSCIVRCKRVAEIKKGPYQVDPVFGGPEYETLSTRGSYCGVANLGAVCKANELCNKYGLDTISCGATISWAMEAFEAGQLTTEHTGGLEIRFGDADMVITLVEMIAAREGFGDLLAEGSARAAEKLAFGADHMGCDHDLSYTKENYPAFEERLSYLGLTDPLHAYSLQPAKVEWVRRTQYLFSFMDSANLCQLCWGASWTLYGPQDMVKLVRAVTGWDMSIDELLEVGERRVVMMRLFNQREGFDAKDDALPDKFFNQPLRGGVSDGVTVDQAEFDAAMVEYYRQSGWDETSGHPTAQTVARLGLESL
ncbi:MAG: aldehyde ferredoxin oxidoreductase family protein [Desulfofustis sp.]